MPFASVLQIRSRPSPGDVMSIGDDGGLESPAASMHDVELRCSAAEELRRRPSGGREEPAQYPPHGVARLLEALAGTAERGDELRPAVVEAATELAGHIRHYDPGHDPEQ